MTISCTYAKNQKCYEPLNSLLCVPSLLQNISKRALRDLHEAKDVIGAPNSTNNDKEVDMVFEALQAYDTQARYGSESFWIEKNI